MKKQQAMLRQQKKLQDHTLGLSCAKFFILVWCVLSLCIVSSPLALASPPITQSLASAYVQKPVSSSESSQAHVGLGSASTPSLPLTPPGSGTRSPC